MLEDGFCVHCAVVIEHPDFYDEPDDWADDDSIEGWEQEVTNELLGDLDSLKDRDIWVNCEQCKTNLRLGAANCIGCGMQFDEAYWREWYQQYWMDIATDEEDEFDLLAAARASAQDANQIQVTKLDEHDNLCCNKHWANCLCDDPILWEEHKFLIPQADREEAYAYNSKCSECINYYEPTCPIYRGWIIDYYKQNSSPGTIDDICDEFVSFVEHGNLLSGEPVEEKVYISTELERMIRGI